MAGISAVLASVVRQVDQTHADISEEVLRMPTYQLQQMAHMFPEPVDWESLPANMQQAATTLEWTAHSWNENRPQRLAWHELSESEQLAALTLHFDSVAWNSKVRTCCHPSVQQQQQQQQRASQR